VLPARPCTPRDKACVEATIGAIGARPLPGDAEKNFYPVPALAVGRTVRVRKTARPIEAFGRNHEALEYDAGIALKFRELRLGYSKSCADHYAVTGTRPVGVSPKRESNFLLLFEELAATHASGSYLKFLKRLNNSRSLVLNDSGLHNYTHEQATALVDFLGERYRKGAATVTSEVDPPGAPR
jgi:hypothetical protein